jgi:hypothetical protein
MLVVPCSIWLVYFHAKSLLITQKSSFLQTRSLVGRCYFGKTQQANRHIRLIKVYGRH